MINYKIIIAFRITVFLGIITGTCTHVQAQPVNNILPHFQSYNGTHYQEKIYLHTDRDLYLAGESIWFKVNCLDGSYHKPSDLSKVVYVQLMKDSIKDVDHAIVSISKGKGSGSIYLPTTLRSGNYILRAYTRWMKNFDEAFFFHRTITVINPFIRLGLSLPGQREPFHADFFPEGGTLVRGSNSKVAFKITDNNGKGLDLQGWLTDEEDRKVAEFSTTHAGTGSFEFVPEADKTYTAHITGQDGRQYDFGFPEIAQYGYSLNVETGDNKITINVNATGINDPKAKLFIHTRNIIHAFSNLNFTGRHAAFVIEKSKMPPGVTHITLFDAAGFPVCERLIFIHPRDLLKIEVTPDHETYSSRDHINLSIKTVVSDKTPIADLSVSVYRYDDHYPVDRTNIISYLLLASDLKGRIENPNYYLTNNADTDRAIDNLMLTQGWRRFQWEDVLQTHPAPMAEIPEYRRMIISGTLKEKSSGKPVRDTLVYLSNPGKYLQTYISQSDSLGKIYFELKNLFGKRQIIVQTQYQPDGGYDLRIDPVFSINPLTNPALPLQIGNDWEKIIKSLSLSMQIKNAYHDVIPAPGTILPDTSLFYGRPDERYFLDNYTRFPVMEEVMREYVHGVLVRRHQGHFRFMVIDPENDKIFLHPPFILFDGVPVFDTDRIMSYDPRKVERIDVVTSNYFIGKKICPGIVNYTTYSGNLEQFDISNADLVMFIDGLQAKRIFYSPEYPDEEAIRSRIPDYRNLLYWEPDVTVDESGTAMIDFYSSDEPGIYKVVVEGITPDGIPGYGETFIEIKQHAGK